MANVIDKAVNWAIEIANDDTHSYSKDIRWGPHYDCSSFVISAYEQAGVSVKSNGATYTGDMVDVFLKNGFKDVTSSINLSTGSGTKKGDVLVNTTHHAALVREDGGAIVHASSPANGICLKNWYNYPWNYVLRYTGGEAQYTDFPRYELSEEMIKELATVITGEQGGDDVLACRQEASQMVNYSEVRCGGSSTEEALRKNIKKVSQGGFYADSSWKRGCTQTAIDAVKFVMIEGKRVLPRYVVEHDTFPLDIISAKNKEEYKVGDSVQNRYGAKYKFYCFFGESKNKDIAGYFLEDYEKYKSDIPWSEGAAMGSSTSEKEYHFIDTNEKIPLHPTLFSQYELSVEDGLNIYISTGINEKDNNNVTEYLGGLEWHNSTDELATSMTFQLAKPQQDWLNYFTPQIGDILRLYTNCEIFRGVIINVDYGDPNYNKYTCYDAGWYLNKTMDTYQFYNITARECIRKILADLSIPIDSISDKNGELDNVTVTDMYIDKSISEILKDIITEKLTGKYNYDFTAKGFRLYPIGTEMAYPEFSVSGITDKYSSILYRGRETHTGSFEDSKTSVKIISDTDVLAVARHDYMYQKYGLIQEVIQVNPDEITNPADYAENKLIEMERPKETYSFEIVEALNSYTRAGESIVIGEYSFAITNTDHEIVKGIHKTKLDVERIEKYAG